MSHGRLNDELVLERIEREMTRVYQPSSPAV